jgi:hypothetical protein
MERTCTWAGVPEVRGFVDGERTTAKFDWPIGIAIDTNGEIIVCDYRNACLRRINPTDGIVSTCVVEFPKENSEVLLLEPIAVTCAKNGDLFVSAKKSVIRISKDGTSEVILELVAGSLTYNDQTLELYVTNPNGEIRMISIPTRQETVIYAKPNRYPVILKISLHSKTGDLYIVDYTDKVRKLSRVKNSPSDIWISTSISILLAEIGQFYQTITVFHDTLFLTTQKGLVVQSSLDGRTVKVIASLSHTMGGIAADSTGVYVTEPRNSTITKIEVTWNWSTYNHAVFPKQARQAIEIFAMASLNSRISTGKCQLQRLPRELLLHILSFLDSN